MHVCILYMLVVGNNEISVWYIRGIMYGVPGIPTSSIEWVFWSVH
jgi:hypothetical protein